MQKVNLIEVNKFCLNHNIEISFIMLLKETGLIKVTRIHEIVYIDKDQLRQLERILHLYYELDINLEGIETITHLLQRIDSLQYEVILLRNKLRLYEADEL